MNSAAWWEYNSQNHKSKYRSGLFEYPISDKLILREQKMDDRESPGLKPRIFNLSTRSKPKVAQNTVTQLLNDEGALNDWVTNVEKIRQVDAQRVAKQAS